MLSIDERPPFACVLIEGAAVASELLARGSSCALVHAHREALGVSRASRGLGKAERRRRRTPGPALLSPKLSPAKALPTSGRSDSAVYSERCHSRTWKIPPSLAVTFLSKQSREVFMATHRQLALRTVRAVVLTFTGNGTGIG